MLRSRLAQLIIVLVLVLGIFVCYQTYITHRAHLTLDNYAAFRGCTSLQNRTATSADCTLASQQTIKLVQINGKWYLDGDGPGVW